jgi:beta-fructofuranosidase
MDENIDHFHPERIDSITKDQEDIPDVRNDWRDPYVFEADNRYFLIIGAAIGDKQTPAVLLFECLDGSLINWKYIKELITFKPVIELFECPNFFKLQDKWVLLGSPYKEVEYYVGTFDVNTLDFTIENSGLIDHCAQFYATNTIQDDKGRTIIVAFERGFSKNEGWNNVISIPRQLSINEDNEIIQKPIDEIYNLRKEKFVVDKTFDLNNIVQIEDERLPQCEINFTINLDGDFKSNLILRENKYNVCQILFSSTGVKFDNILIPFKKQNKIEVKLLIDHSVLELYLNGGQHCATRVIEAIKDLSILEFRGNGSIENLSVYEMGDLSITE